MLVRIFRPPCQALDSHLGKGTWHPWALQSVWSRALKPDLMLSVQKSALWASSWQLLQTGVHLYWLPKSSKSAGVRSQDTRMTALCWRPGLRYFFPWKPYHTLSHILTWAGFRPFDRLLSVYHPITWVGLWPLNLLQGNKVQLPDMASGQIATPGPPHHRDLAYS